MANPMTTSRGTLLSDATSSDPDLARKYGGKPRTKRTPIRRVPTATKLDGEDGVQVKATNIRDQPVLATSPRSSASLQQPNTRPVADTIQLTDPEDENSEAKGLGEKEQDHGLGNNHKKPKGVSFLSRIIGTTKKKDSFPAYDNYPDNTSSVFSDQRPEGVDAQVFAQDVANIEYNPRHPQPPAYIKVRTKNKKVKEFDRLFLAQELDPPAIEKKATDDGKTPNSSKTSLATGPNSIWAMAFSRSGKYLAVGSQDGVIRIYAVLGTPDDRRQFEADAQLTGTETRLNAPVFHERVFREYKGHTGPITDLHWSKSDFLISSSMDKTAKLWHTSRVECLCTFKHNEQVLSVRFHPLDDRFFLSGCRDARLRLFSIPDKHVAYAVQVPDAITAVAFVPDGNQCMAGTMNGTCYFFDTEKLKPRGKLIAKSTHGKNARGSKINSIDAFDHQMKSNAGNDTGEPLAEVRILISSADSRLRLYNASDRSLEAKFKGHKAEELPIRACVSDCGRYISTGSEDRGAHIWTNGPPEKESKNGQRPMECFDAHKDRVTVTTIAPAKARQLLGRSHDPIYELCHPPPVQLMSRSESHTSSHPPTADDSSIQESPPRLNQSASTGKHDKHYELSKAYHESGHIIVTASSAGVIRVYRQDCGYTKRKTFESEDKASIFSGGSRTRPSSTYMRRAMLGRENSTSSSQGVARSDSVTTQPPQERIMSWRQGISSNASLERDRAGSSASSQRHGSDPFNRMRRNGSPRKSVGSASMLSAHSRLDNYQSASPKRNSATIPELVLPESPSDLAEDITTPTNARHPRSHPAPSIESTEGSPSPSPGDQTSASEAESRQPDNSTTATTAAIEKSYTFYDPRAYLPSVKFLSTSSIPIIGSSLRPSLSGPRRKSHESAVSKLSSEEEDENERRERR